MMNLVRKLILFLATGMLMLHTLLPHEHHEDSSGENHFVEFKDADSIIDYLRLAFHFNPGENHLEDFNKSQDNALDFNNAQDYTPNFIYPSVQSFQYDVQFQVLTQYSSVAASENLSEINFLAPKYFRGPPQLI